MTNRVKQNCAPSPILFSLMFSARLMNAYLDEHPGIRITRRTDEQHLNRRHTQVVTNVSMATAGDLFFAGV
ncbi:unnamed protein product [Schistocephalus solidus]|uniref:LysR family transcriptional regulator n=1 Tax=Schistocephalus solidus TaxID=70667 RepID=A0A183SEL0_SCHSO|nr:unnamed protein product [Schistocephalus solidus]